MSQAPDLAGDLGISAKLSLPRPVLDTTSGALILVLRKATFLFGPTDSSPSETLSITNSLSKCSLLSRDSNKGLLLFKDSTIPPKAATIGGGNRKRFQNGTTPNSRLVDDRSVLPVRSRHNETGATKSFRLSGDRMLLCSGE